MRDFPHDSGTVDTYGEREWDRKTGRERGGKENNWEGWDEEERGQKERSEGRAGKRERERDEGTLCTWGCLVMRRTQTVLACSGGSFIRNLCQED